MTSAEARMLWNSDIPLWFKSVVQVSPREEAYSQERQLLLAEETSKGGIQL